MKIKQKGEALSILKNLVIYGRNLNDLQKTADYVQVAILTLLFPSACTLRRRGETQMSVGCQASGL